MDGVGEAVGDAEALLLGVGDRDGVGLGVGGTCIMPQCVSSTLCSLDPQQINSPVSVIPHTWFLPTLIVSHTSFNDNAIVEMKLSILVSEPPPQQWSFPTSSNAHVRSHSAQNWFSVHDRPGSRD